MQWSKFRSADSTDACLLVSTNGTCIGNRGHQLCVFRTYYYKDTEKSAYLRT